MQDNTINPQNQNPATGPVVGPPPDITPVVPTEIPPVPPSSPARRRALIPTILGLVLLVVGVGAGLLLVQQQQIFKQKASECSDYCAGANQCSSQNGHIVGSRCSGGSCTEGTSPCLIPAAVSTAPSGGGTPFCTGSSTSDRGQCPTAWKYVYPGNGCQQSNGSFLGRCCQPGDTACDAPASTGGTGTNTLGGEGDSCTTNASCASPLTCITCIDQTVKAGQKVCKGNAGSLIACGGYANATGRVCTTGDRKACGDCSGANGEPSGGAGPTQQAYCNALGQWDCIRTDRCGEIGNRLDGAACIYASSCLSGVCTSKKCVGNAAPTSGKTCSTYDGRTVGNGGFAGCGNHYNKPSNYDCFCNNGTIQCAYDADRQSCAAPAGTIEAVGGTPTAPTTSTTPTTSQETAQCQAIKAYDTNWNLLTNAQLAQLKAGDKVRFTVTGTTTSGTFDKARFTVNGTLGPETTTTKPSANQEFYYEYTIPAGTTSFTVTSEIHHAQLNTWN